MKKILSTGNSYYSYYKSMNNLYIETFGKHHMLHYPLYVKDDETLEQRQRNLSLFVFDFFTDWEHKDVLEVGCGNGTQAVFLSQTHTVKSIRGIDLNADNIAIARELGKDIKGIDFQVDNAQTLSTIADGSVDILLCIESAFHYPDKLAFLKQVKRVLKPDGQFVIVDVVLSKRVKKYISNRWRKRMRIHHWTEAEYMNGLEAAGLSLTGKSDISNEIIKGYQGFKNWVSKHYVKNTFKFLVLKIFAFIHCWVNIRDLKKKTKYYVMLGKV